MDISDLINEILKEWNPIGVKGQDLDHEYERYINEIVECAKNGADLLGLIEDIEGNRIGFFYTSADARLKVVEKVKKLFESSQ